MIALPTATTHRAADFSGLLPGWDELVGGVHLLANAFLRLAVTAAIPAGIASCVERIRNRGKPQIEDSPSRRERNW